MTSHKIASIVQSSIKGPATFKTSQSCHKRKCGPSGHNESRGLLPYKVQDAVCSILERSGGDLEKASQLLDERLNATNKLIRELTESSDSLPHEEFRERLKALKAQHRGAAEMTEDLRVATAAATADSVNGNGHWRKSVTFDNSKPPLPPGTAGTRNGGGNPAALEPADSRRGPEGSRSFARTSASYENLADDFEQQEAEDPRREQQERLRSRVKALWSDFDAKGSATRVRAGSLDRSWQRPSSAGPRGSDLSSGDDGPESWRHRVTVPRPFSMTLREETEKQQGGEPQQLRKSRSMRVLEEDARRRREAQEAELRVRPRAAPVPAHIYQPLLSQLNESREARRREVREHSAEILRATERPFNFAKRDAERKRQGRERATEADKQRGYHRSSAGDRESTVIRARPAPPSCAAERSRQLRQEAELRRAMARARSEATMRASAMPGGMAERQRLMEAKRDARLAMQHRRNRAGSADGLRVGRDAPDFERMHRQFELEMLERQAELRVTRPQPFNLLTVQRAQAAQQHADRCLASGQDPKALRTLYDFSRRYPTDSAEDADAEEAADAAAAAAERERKRLGAVALGPEDEYKQKLRELDRKMKERDSLLAEQARILAHEKACARYRESLLLAGVEPARVGALVRAYRDRELALTDGRDGDLASDDFSSMPNESEFDEEFDENLDEIRFGAPSPVPN